MRYFVKLTYHDSFGPERWVINADSADAACEKAMQLDNRYREVNPTPIPRVIASAEAEEMP